MLIVNGAMAFESADVGIYTYRTPNENASTAVEDFHFGIYTLQYAGIQLHYLSFTLGDGI